MTKVTSSNARINIASRHAFCTFDYCTVIGLDKQNFFSVKLEIFSYPSVLTYILGAQKNRLIETVLKRTVSLRRFF